MSSAESVRTDPRLRCLREEIEDHNANDIAAMIVALNKRHVVERALARIDGPDLCFVLTEENGSFCGRTLPCPEHIDGGES